MPVRKAWQQRLKELIGLENSLEPVLGYFYYLFLNRTSPADHEGLLSGLFCGEAPIVGEVLYSRAVFVWHKSSTATNHRLLANQISWKQCHHSRKILQTSVQQAEDLKVYPANLRRNFAPEFALTLCQTSTSDFRFYTCSFLSAHLIDQRL